MSFFIMPFIIWMSPATRLKFFRRKLKGQPQPQLENITNMESGSRNPESEVCGGTNLMNEENSLHPFFMGFGELL